MADKPIIKLTTPGVSKNPAPAKAAPLADKPLPIIAAQVSVPVIEAPLAKAKSPPTVPPVAAKSSLPKPLPKLATPKSVMAKPPFAATVQSIESKTADPAPAGMPVVEPKPTVAAAPVPTIAKPSQPASPVPAALITEGNEKVTETFTKIEDKAQNFAADATTRVKSVMEKGSKGVEELVEFSKGNLEAVVASGRVAAKGAEEMAKYAADYGRTTIEKANATAKQFAGVKSPTEFFQLQSEMAKSSLDAFVGEASKFGENYMKLLGEIAQPIQGRYALAVEKVKTAVSA